jgi:hypothetical protein
LRLHAQQRSFVLSYGSRGGERCNHRGIHSFLRKIASISRRCPRQQPGRASHHASSEAFTFASLSCKTFLGAYLLTIVVKQNATARHAASTRNF